MFFCLLAGVCRADMLSTSSVLAGTSKRMASGLQMTAAVGGQVASSAAAGSRYLVASAKNKPGVAKVTGGDFTSVSGSTLRRKLSSRSAIIIDSHTGQILYAHEPDLAAQPASTIKVLTGLIAMNSLPDKAKVQVSPKAANMPRSKVYLHQGRHYNADDLIDAVLVSSANDASVALAEKVAGSEQAFTELMNFKARQLGARNTVCKTASGLTARGQRSTVRDLATIFNNAMRDAEFADRIGKVRTTTSYGRKLSNHNRALWRIDGAMAGKTGYTHAARQTYVGMFQRGGNAITVAIMGSETMWDDVGNLVEYGFVRRNQLVAAGRLADKPTVVASLSPGPAGSPGKRNEAAAGYAPILTQTSKQRKM